jgi:MoaA/NifB/PqqE/SkfB family radical SAM enzyme
MAALPVAGDRGSAPAPAVSVVLTAWRRAETLGAAMDSVLAQEGVALELVVVADGCAASKAVAQERAVDPRVRVLSNPVNQGAARARNRGAGQARAKLVAFLAADDRLLPGALARAVSRFAGRPHLGLVYGDLALEDGGGRPRGVLQEPEYTGETAFLAQPFDTPFLVVRADALKAIGGVDEAAVRCWNASLVGRVGRRLHVEKVPGAPLVAHRVDGRNRSLAYRPGSCAACASSTSCALSKARRASAGRESHRLRKLSLVLTTRCNLDCGYCFTRRYKWDIPLEDALRLMVQARDRGAEVLALTGGEPSLYEGFDEVLGAAGDLGLRVLVISNGWSWPDARLQRFVALPGAQLGISLEGRSPALHDAIRGKNSHAKLLEFLSRARAFKPDLPVLGVVVATQDNLDQLEDICEWALDELRCAGLRIDRVVPSGNAEADGEFSPEATRRYLSVVAKVRARWPDRVEAIAESFSPDGCPLYTGLERGMHDLQVFSDGTVPACVYMHMDRPTRLGLAAQDVDELIERANVARVRRLVGGAFDDRARQIARKGLFTCVECMERRNALDAADAWPKLVELGLGHASSPPAAEPAGRPLSAAERSGIEPPLVVVG